MPVASPFYIERDDLPFAQIENVQNTTLHNLSTASYPVFVLLKALDGRLIGLDKKRVMDSKGNQAKPEYNADQNHEYPLRVKQILGLSSTYIYTRERDREIARDMVKMIPKA